MRIFKIVSLALAFAAFQMPFHHCAFADALDDNIRILEEILNETKLHYKSYVDLKFESDIKVQYIQTMSDYLDLMRELSRKQEQSKAVFIRLKLDWDTKVAELQRDLITVTDFSHRLLDVLLIRQKFDDEIATLKSIRSDLDSLIQFWPNRCDENKVRWRLERNEPIKTFVMTNAAAVALPREGGELSFNLSDGTVNPPASGRVGTSGMVSTLAGAGAAELVKMGALKGLASASAATPVGAAIAVAVFVVWNGVDSAIEAGKQSKQWKLIADIREFQIAGVQKTQQNAQRIISDVCHEFLLSEFGDKIQVAVNKNQALVNQAVLDAEKLAEDWLAIGDKYKTLIDDLERTYFPQLAERTLIMMNEVALKRYHQTRASMTFIKEKISPSVLQLRAQPHLRPSVTQEYWNQLIIGDSLFGACTDDPWQDLKTATLGRMMQ